MRQGHPGAQELARIHEVDYVDLPTGHWPQFTRPGELARIILDILGSAVAPAADSHSPPP